MSAKSSMVGSEPRRISLDVRRRVLHEAGYKCANPNCFTPYLETHHLVYVSEGGDDEACNLIPLCVVCHTRHHKGEIPTESLRAWKIFLITVNEAYDRRATDLLLVLADLDEIYFTFDGLPAYASLAASGMVQVGRQTAKLCRIKITEKGKMFVEGWKKGDQRAALGLPPSGSA